MKFPSSILRGSLTKGGRECHKHTPVHPIQPVPASGDIGEICEFMYSKTYYGELICLGKSFTNCNHHTSDRASEFG